MPHSTGNKQRNRQLNRVSTVAVPPGPKNRKSKGDLFVSCFQRQGVSRTESQELAPADYRILGNTCRQSWYTKEGKCYALRGTAKQSLICREKACHHFQSYRQVAGDVC